MKAKQAEANFNMIEKMTDTSVLKDIILIPMKHQIKTQQNAIAAQEDTARIDRRKKAVLLITTVIEQGLFIAIPIKMK